MYATYKPLCFCSDCSRLCYRRFALYLFDCGPDPAVTRYCHYSENSELNRLKEARYKTALRDVIASWLLEGYGVGVRLRISYNRKFNYFEFNPRNAKLFPRVCRDQSQSQTLIGVGAGGERSVPETERNRGGDLGQIAGHLKGKCGTL